jgi:hypothetical protein
VRRIGRAGQTCIGGSRHVYVSAPQAGRNAGRDVFVKMKADRHRSGRFFDALLAQFRFDQGWLIAAELLRKRALISHLLLNVFDVVEVVSEGGVNIRERDRRNVRNDFIRRYDLMLMPYDNIEDTNAVAGNASFAAANAGRLADPVLPERGHDLSIRA